MLCEGVRKITTSPVSAECWQSLDISDIAYLQELFSGANPRINRHHPPLAGVAVWSLAQPPRAATHGSVGGAACHC